MKQLIAILLIAGALLAFAGCHEEVPNETVLSDEYTDNYIYTFLDSVFSRVNVLTGSVTNVCPDPICSHTEEGCPFYGFTSSSPFIVEGKYFYYAAGRNSWGDATMLCRYNLESQKSDVLYDSEKDGGYILRLFKTEDMLYFTVHNVGSQNSDESAKSEGIYDVYRCDLNGKKRVRLTDKPLLSMPDAYAYDGDKMYWKDDIGYFTTDINFKSIVYGERGYSALFENQKYGYYLEGAGTVENSGITSMVVNLIGYDYENKTSFTALEKVPLVPLPYNNKILYTMAQDNPRLIGYHVDELDGTRKPQYDVRGGKIYICDNDGKNTRLLCDFSKTGFYLNEANVPNGKRGVGDWVAFLGKTAAVDENNNIAENKSGVLLVNISTGEYKLAEY